MRAVEDGGVDGTIRVSLVLAPMRWRDPEIVARLEFLARRCRYQVVRSTVAREWSEERGENAAGEAVRIVVEK